MNKALALRIVLIVVCVPHLTLGLTGYFAPVDLVTQVLKIFYNATVTLTPQLQHAARIVGAYMLAFSVLSALALWKPEQNRHIINGVIILLLLRVGQRMIFAAQIHEVFQIPYWYHWGQSAFFLAIAVALFFLRPKESKV
jgi:hypothetical protein